MAEIPPGSEPPPPQAGTPAPDYTKAYFRPSDIPYGSAEKLQALADGYFGLNKVFLVNVLLAIGLRVMLAVVTEPASALIAVVGALVVLLLAITFLTLPCNKKIAFGKGWPESSAILASILMGFNSALCCGIIGYVVMQQIAASEMKNYGLRTGFLGIKKKDIAAKVEALRNSPRPPGF